MEIIKKNKNNINKIITALKKGAVLVFPTDTVYGLVCDASNKKAVEKIFKIKKRDKSKPLGVFVKDIKTAFKIAVVKKEYEKFLKNNKNTVILKSRLRQGFGGRSKKTIGIRIPKYKFLNLILDEFKKPIAQTSANISGKPATTKIKEVLKQLGKENILIIDAGDLIKNKPSAIIDLTGAKNKIIRK
ncbi:MAG: L-threonylcarbamoyladenylate synthase [Candidatus Staskawiczbacteria bacterium]|jgi:L-threonylcarbamoyladenylate synthase